METKQAQERWHVDEDSRKGMDWNRHIVDSSGLRVCFMAHSGGSDIERDKQRANMVAAAPELLVVARDFDDVLTELDLHCECGEADCRTTRLRAAIAKATGAA